MLFIAVIFIMFIVWCLFWAILNTQVIKCILYLTYISLCVLYILIQILFVYLGFQQNISCKIQLSVCKTILANLTNKKSSCKNVFGSRLNWDNEFVVDDYKRRVECCRLQQLVITSRPAIAGNPHCKNITAKSVHLTSLYPTALTSTNDHLSVLRHYVCT